MTNEERLEQSYSIRAEELRTLAELDGQVRTREILMEVARGYERMAGSMAAIERTNRSFGKG